MCQLIHNWKRVSLILLLVCQLLPVVGNAQAKRNSAQKPFQTIQTIFKSYIKYHESTDSPESEQDMKQAINSLNSPASGKELTLLVDVWMYYDPTDFPTRDIILPVFNKNKSASLTAITNRLKKMRKWESTDTAPYSDLLQLEKDLK